MLKVLQHNFIAVGINLSVRESSPVTSKGSDRLTEAKFHARAERIG